MRRRRLLIHRIPWWAPAAAGAAGFVIGLLVLAFVMIGYLAVTDAKQADSPWWLGVLCCGPGLLLLIVGIPWLVIGGLRTAHSKLRSEWVSSHDLREEYRQ